jgi:predicted RNase H-like nuclease
MTRVTGIDGAPGGWAVVIMEAERSSIRKIAKLSDFLDSTADFKVIAIDVPIGLLDAYEVGGRTCDRAARKLLGRPRGSSVFPAPVRPVLSAKIHTEACDCSRASASQGKGITIQTFNILDKIREVDDLLRERPQLRGVVREVHPEVCFCELVGKPMTHHKASPSGREERRKALTPCFPELNEIVTRGTREQGLPIEDIVDATVACWSALRLAAGQGRSLPDVVPLDAMGLPMAIWV